MKATNYILVADSGQAKIYKSDSSLDALELVAEYENAAGRLTRSELDSDRPGIQRNSMNGAHGLGGDKNTHQHEADVFALDLCKQLHAAHLAGEFKELMIAAPPKFLGSLRQHLGQDCQNVLIKTVNKDLVRSDKKAVLSHLTGD